MNIPLVEFAWPKGCHGAYIKSYISEAKSDTITQPNPVPQPARPSTMHLVLHLDSKLSDSLSQTYTHTFFKYVLFVSLGVG